MAEFKKFEKVGSQFIMKRQYGFGLVVVIGMLAFAIGGVYYKNTPVIWIFGILTVLCFISIWAQQFIIDMEKKEFIIKNGLINKPLQIPLSNFVNFELVKIKHNFITTNVSLNLYYMKDTKEKCMGIAQGFSTRSMQNLINEINEIIQPNERY